MTTREQITNASAHKPVVLCTGRLQAVSCVAARNMLKSVLAVRKPAFRPRDDNKLNKH